MLLPTRTAASAKSLLSVPPLSNPHHPNHRLKVLLPRRLHRAIPLLRRSHHDLLTPRHKTLPRLLRELIERHANGAAVLQTRLMLLIVQLR